MRARLQPDVGVYRQATATQNLSVISSNLKSLSLSFFLSFFFITQALDATRLVSEHWGGALNYCELRTVRADSQLLSPYTGSGGEDTLAIACGVNISLGEEVWRCYL